MGQIHRSKCVDHTFDLPWREMRAFDTEDARVVEGIATTPSIDRMGDVVLPEGAIFSLPIPLLWMHDPAAPVGNVTAALVTSEGIKFRAEFAPRGVHPAIDRHWAEVKAGLVRHVSIGFRELKSKIGKTGKVFTSWEWLELSHVTIPANGEATVTAVKAFPVPQRGAPPRPESLVSGVIARSVGAPAAPAKSTGAKPMTIAERIAATKAALVQLKDRLAIASAEDVLDEERAAEIDELVQQIDAQQTQLDRLEASEQRLAARAALPPQPKAYTPNVVTLKRDAPKGDLLFKAMTAQLYAHVERRSLDEVVRSHYNGHAELDAFIRAATVPANTTTPGWALELVQTTIADFIESLIPLSVYAALTSKGIRFGFGRFGKVTVPGRSSSATLAGDWIGEGLPIPVKQGSITGVSLTPHKLAVISTFTRELAMQSTPQIEGLIRQMILEDTAGALDKFLMDAVASNAIRPAGLRNGVAAIASSGSTLNNVITDLKAALTPILAAGGGRRLVWLINPARLASLSLMTNAAGGFMFRDEVAQGRLIGYEFIASNNVPADAVILVDAADFASASGDVPAFDVSDVATLHMEGDPAAVAPIVGGSSGTPAPAYPTRSLWQTASVGVRMIQDLSWGMRRSGMVQHLSGVAW